MRVLADFLASQRGIFGYCTSQMFVAQDAFRDMGGGDES